MRVGMSDLLMPANSSARRSVGSIESAMPGCLPAVAALSR